MELAGCRCCVFTRNLVSLNASFTSFTKRVISTHFCQQKKLFEKNKKLIISLQKEQTRRTHRPPFIFPEINTEEVARSAALRLNEKGRVLMLQELQRLECDPEGNNLADPKVPASDLWEVFVFHGVPFIGFGMLDNMIMILAGEYIDVTLGAALGISTMAAAALGNLVSDVAGVGSAGYVELMAEKVGVKAPRLSPRQLSAWQTRWSIGLGRAAGITIGCLIGMFPLLFFERKIEDDDDATEDATRSHRDIKTENKAKPAEGLISTQTGDDAVPESQRVNS